MADIKLRECPWCGQEPEILFDAVEGDTYGMFLIHHRVDKCGVHKFGFYRYATKEEAIKHWNTRATDSTIEAQEAEIKRLRKIIESYIDDISVQALDMGDFTWIPTVEYEQATERTQIALTEGE